MAEVAQPLARAAAGLSSAHRVSGAAAVGALIAIAMVVMWLEVERHHRRRCAQPAGPSRAISHRGLHEPAGDGRRSISWVRLAGSDGYLLRDLADAMEKGHLAGQDQWILPDDSLGRPSATADLRPVTIGTIMSIWRQAHRIETVFNRR
jgi:hypothetical protein